MKSEPSRSRRSSAKGSATLPAVSLPVVWAASRVIHHRLPVPDSQLPRRRGGYLPGVAAPPTGLRGDAQALAAGLVGHEGELPHGAASEAVEGAGQGDARRQRPGDQEQEERAVHPGKYGHVE